MVLENIRCIDSPQILKKNQSLVSSNDTRFIWASSIVRLGVTVININQEQGSLI